MPLPHPLPDPWAWRLVIPLKGGARAKSRLEVPGRARVVRAMTGDLLEAVAELAETTQVTVHVVTADPEVRAAASAAGHECVDDPGSGLDDAVLAGASSASSPVATLVGDLPCLRAADLEEALARCATALRAGGRAFVPDLEGTGTVLLAARDAAALTPSFGAGSAARHGAGATRLDLDLPRLRRDVDDLATLEQAARLGVGPRLTALLAAPLA